MSKNNENFNPYTAFFNLNVNSLGVKFKYDLNSFDSIVG